MSRLISLLSILGGLTAPLLLGCGPSHSSKDSSIPVGRFVTTELEQVTDYAYYTGRTEAVESVAGWT
jgi:hypothetical protein